MRHPRKSILKPVQADSAFGWYLLMGRGQTPLKSNRRGFGVFRCGT